MARRTLSTFAVAEMLEVDPGSVANWIDKGALRAHRTPGGHRRILVDDLVAFLKAHHMPLPPQLAPPVRRVVVVDDEPDMAAMMARAVRKGCPDCEVIEANDGFEAGSIIATSKPDVVILDLRMPGMDGFEVCRRIKADPATADAVVIAVTAYPALESQKRITQCGAKACLAKPLDIEALVAEVKTDLAEG